jgi:CRP-like cAMP-binding protein
MLILNYSNKHENLKQINFKHNRSLNYNLKQILKNKITSHLISLENFDKGTLLIEEGKPVNGLYFIIKGKIKIFNTGYNQKNKTLRLLSKGDIVGLSSLNSPSYWASGLIVENTEAYFVNLKNLEAILKSNNKLCILLIKSLAMRLRYYEIRQKHLCLFPTSERIIDALLLTAYKFGEITGPEMEISICTSRRDLAEFSNTSVNQTINTLNKLKDKNYITVDGKNIIIRKKKELINQLKQYSDSEKLTEEFNFYYPDLIY